MDYDRMEEYPSGIRLVNVKNFGLYETFNSGSVFRWVHYRDYYVGTVHDKIIIAKPYNNDLLLYNITGQEFKDYFEDYFDLKINYQSMYSDIRERNEVLQKLLPATSHIRILKQDFLESFVSAFISQNNNISRIKLIINKLCSRYGKKIKYKNIVSYTFPKLEVLAQLSEEDYNRIGFGYRAKGMSKAMRRLYDLNIDDFYEYFKSWKCVEVLNFLTDFYQVGPKVANFIITMAHLSQNYEDAFVIDVWMKRAMMDLFNVEVPTEYWLKQHFSNLVLAQQNIFYYYRN